MLNIAREVQFKRDVKRMQKRGKNMSKLRDLLLLLIEEVPLPVKYKDHPLKQNWAGWRDAHIEPDWLLIYQIAGRTLRLARTGTHTDIFNH
ncbi:mRNA interferase toxin YafQ [Halomonadaceae bacterium LMG 33818]|uniref:type II toxin-antitoxin system YafQ family toxin n=1 Tax=Cernens ardua TaxID=3402176 RepID=UPI003EDB99E4